MVDLTSLMQWLTSVDFKGFCHRAHLLMGSSSILANCVNWKIPQRWDCDLLEAVKRKISGQILGFSVHKLSIHLSLGRVPGVLQEKARWILLLCLLSLHWDLARVHHRLANEVTLAAHTPFPLMMTSQSEKEEWIVRLRGGMTAHCSVPYSLVEQ